MKRILSLFFGFLLFNGSLGINCPTGTIQSLSGNTCWLLVSNALDFITAEKYCQNNGGHLTSIHNGFDNAQLTDAAKTQFPGAELFAIGGSDLQDRQTWNWTDGSTVDFTDWANCKLKLL